jgi:hypothetical protein
MLKMLLLFFIKLVKFKKNWLTQIIEIDSFVDGLSTTRL